MPLDIRHSKVLISYWDHFRVSQVVGANNVGFARDEWEIPKTEGEKEYLPGKFGTGQSTLNGYMDVTEATGWDVLEYEPDGAIHYVARLPQGLGSGLRAIETQERDSGDSRVFDQGGGALLNWSGQGTGKSFMGLQISAGAENFTGTGQSTGVEVGATASDETFVAVIRVVGVDGAGSVTFQLQESQDDGSGDAYAQITGLTIAVDDSGNVSAGTDEVTFTGVGVAYLYVTGATEAWKRLSVSAFSTFTSVDVVATAGASLIV